MAMTLRLTSEQDARLEAIALSLGVSKHQAIIELIEAAESSAKRRVKYDAIFDKVVQRDSKLLDRLADA